MYSGRRRLLLLTADDLGKVSQEAPSVAVEESLKLLRYGRQAGLAINIEFRTRRQSPR